MTHKNPILTPEPRADPLDSLTLLEEYLQSSLRVPADQLQSAIATLAGTRLFSALFRADPDALSQRLQEKPELCIRVIHAMCALGDRTIAQQKLELRRDQAKQQQIARDQRRRQFLIRNPIVVTRDTINSLDPIQRNEPAESANPNPRFRRSRRKEALTHSAQPPHTCVPLPEAA